MLATTAEHHVLSPARFCAIADADALVRANSSPAGMAAAAAPEVAEVPRFVRLLFVRHGQSENNILMRKSHAAYSAGELWPCLACSRARGRASPETIVVARSLCIAAGRIADPRLTMTGRRQANAAGRFFARMCEAGTGPSHVVVSPMVRALETAKPIAAACGAAGTASRLLAWPEACECGGVFGRDGAAPVGRVCHELTREEVEAELPGVACHEGITDKGWWRPGRKETDAERTIRCMAACRVMRSWADTGEIALPTVDQFDKLSVDMEARLATLRRGQRDEDGAHDPDSAGRVDADVGELDAKTPKALPKKGGEENHPGPVATVAIVCHHDFIDRSIALLTHGGDPPPSGALYAPEPTLHFCFNNASVSVVDLYPGGTTRVVRLNDVRHLDPVYTGRRGMLTGFWQDTVVSNPEDWDGDEEDEFESPTAAP